MLKASQNFFQLPDAAKKMYTKRTDQVNTFSGYYVSQRQNYRQRYDITLDSKYPVEVPDFEESFTNYRRQCNRLVKYLFVLIAKSLNLEDHEFFVKKHSAIFDASSNSKSHLSTIFYKTACDEYLMDKHTDISTFTLVFAPSPGLQILCNNEWVTVNCEPNEIVFHSGDLLERWTGGLRLATVHRVFNFNNTDDARISIPYFVHPNCNAVVQPLFNCYQQYEPVTAEDYWKSKFN